MIKVAFRFDDPSLTSNHDLESRVIDISSRFSIKINFAVIPYKSIKGQLQSFSREKARHLVESYTDDLIEISQHGYAHVNVDSTDDPSEFFGVPAGQQLEMIHGGKKVLDNLFSTKNRGFVPPWNSFDHNTLRIIETNDFLFLSAGWKIPESVPSHIPLLPRTCHIHTLIETIEHNQSYQRLEPIFIVVLHHYDFFESGSNQSVLKIEEFTKILEGLSKMEDVKFTSLNEIASEISGQQTQQGISDYNNWNRKHWRIRRFFPKNCLIIDPPNTLLPSLTRNVVRHCRPKFLKSIS